MSLYLSVNVNYMAVSVITLEIMLPSKQMMFIYLGFDACNIRVCLTWTVQNDYLDLRCRVNHLIYAVEFYNNKRIELGYCASPKPAPKCLSPYSNISISQNTKTNITYLRISGHMDSAVNGQWECKHGTNINSDVINVTVLDSGNFNNRYQN